MLEILSFLSICGGLRENGRLRFIGSGTIKKCGLAGADVPLLEEVCY